jgi:hypothetical protein
VGPAVATVILSAYKDPVFNPITHEIVGYIASETAYQYVFLLSAVAMAVAALMAIFLTDKRALGEGKGFAVRSLGNGMGRNKRDKI